MSQSTRLGRDSGNRNIVEPFWDERAIEECVCRSQQTDSRSFLSEFEEFLSASGQIHWTSGGREAIRTILAQALPARSSVAICRFNCSVVAEAVRLAGHTVETFDLDDTDGRIDWERVGSRLSHECRAVVVTHYFGLASGFEPLVDLSKRRPLLLLEDCAHAFGASVQGRMAGTLGDAAIFSFNDDKPICLAGGGALLLNNPDLFTRVTVSSGEAIAVEAELAHLKRFLQIESENRRELSRRRLPQRIARRLRTWAAAGWREPSLGSGFLGPLRNELGLWQLERYSAVRERRNRNAAYVAASIKGVAWMGSPEDCSAALRLKVIPENPDSAARISKTLQSQGYAVGPLNWPQTVQPPSGSNESRNAEFVARYGIDVPIHQNMLPEDFAAILHAFRVP